MYTPRMNLARLDSGMKVLAENGGSFSRTMPRPRVSLGVDPYESSASPKLWSRTSPSRLSSHENAAYFRGRSNNSGDYRVRHSSGCSPSRLRSVFDQSM
ncbi:hypothetical protein Ciccas_001462 [Cichlidogyrus casuarinus]|uniref:Uncharacterized protein n=1 Tax=Cichlidogyrus casuarinus TaxID=1844966 RepID=A0ABD2QN42_9PLAT